MCRLSWNMGALNFWNPLGHSRPVTGLLYLYHFAHFCYRPSRLQGHSAAGRITLMKITVTLPGKEIANFRLVPNKCNPSIAVLKFYPISGVYVTTSGDSSVCIVIRLLVWRPRYRRSNPDNGKMKVSIPEGPDPLCRSPSILFTGYRGRISPR